MIPYSKKLVSKANAAKKYDTRRKAFAISRLLNYCDLKHMRETPQPSAFGCHLLPLEKAIKNAVSLTEIMPAKGLRRHYFCKKSSHRPIKRFVGTLFLSRRNGQRKATSQYVRRNENASFHAL